MAIPAMTKNEILNGEIIRQNGIKNILEEFGFKENKDFIFIPERQGVYYPFENGIKGSELKLGIENVRGSVDSNGHIRAAVTSGNNGVGAIYVPFQGMVLAPTYYIKNIIEEEFSVKDTDFGVPLSNGERFLSNTLQSNWDNVVSDMKLHAKNRIMSPEEEKAEKIKMANKVMKGLEKLKANTNMNKMPEWAKQQLATQEY